MNSGSNGKWRYLLEGNEGGKWVSGRVHDLRGWVEVEMSQGVSGSQG